MNRLPKDIQQLIYRMVHCLYLTDVHTEFQSLLYCGHYGGCGYTLNGVLFSTQTFRCMYNYRMLPHPTTYDIWHVNIHCGTREKTSFPFIE